MNDNITLHVIHNDKFIPAFIDFIEQHFDFDQHRFFIMGDVVKYPIKKRRNIFFAENSGIRKIITPILLAQYMNGAEKIILHGLLDFRVVQLLFLQPWLLKKCYWVMWGWDLYTYQLGERGWKWHIKEFLRRPVIRNLGHLVTFVKGDYVLAQKWYGAKGQYHECLMYPSNLYKESAIQPKAHTTFNIQVGNSAHPTNNHLEIFEKLEPYKEQDLKIYAPLSYGQQAYAQEVIRVGRALFGDKFIPLTDFMPFEDYLKLQVDIDIAIFAHKRQQAMGNIVTLLGLGKKVYMRSDITPWQLFSSIGVKVFDIKDLQLTPMTREQRDLNRQLVKEHFSSDMLKRQFMSIFPMQS